MNKKNELMRKIHPELRQQDRLSRLTGPAGYWLELRSYQLDFMKAMGLLPYHTLLDIGCGPLQGGIAFMDYLDAGKYVGIDISDVPLAEAYGQVVEHGLVHKNPRLVLSDSFGGSELDGCQFDYAWTCQTLYHLDPKTIERYFRTVSRLLRPGGFLYGDILGRECTTAEDTLWNGLRHIRHSFEFMRVNAEKYCLGMDYVGKIKDFGYPVPNDLRYNDMLRFQKKKKYRGLKRKQ